MQIDWKQIKYFKRSEFDSPDLPGSGDLMDFQFLLKLDEMRRLLGKPIVINSGYRTSDHHVEIYKELGKTPVNSAHLRGLAVDIACENSFDRFEIVNIAYILSIPRIEVCSGHVHIDIDPSLPQKVLLHG